MIALYRTDRGRFAVDERGDWQPSIKTTIVTPREDGLSVSYACGLLNSELLDLWYAVRGKTPWHVRRNYEPKPMNEIPYRHVPQADGWTPSDDIGLLADALSRGDVLDALPHAAAVRSAVGSASGDSDAVAAIEHLVRGIAANRQALLPLRGIAPELRRAVKNPWRTHGVRVDRGASVRDLPEAATRSVRLDPDLGLTITTDGVLGRARLDGDELVFTHARRPTARVSGPHERLLLLQQVLGTGRMMPDSLTSARLPSSLSDFADEAMRRQADADVLLDEGRQLVEAVERLVCALYGVPDPLTDLVVASAVARAGTVAEADE